MDASTRWETEALREGDRPRPSPPKPTKATRKAQTNWVTLKEAEAATGIPVNTLRKWVRKSTLPSYLESDGDIALRMVDLDAVEQRARELGRTIEVQTTELGQELSAVDQPSAPGTTPDPGQRTPEQPPPASRQPSAVPESPAWEPEADDRQQTSDSRPTPPAVDGTVDEGATMMVPVDAWNKMLAQLGNLHEAGQQLAEARERAAKAETEAVFLRERLAEMRAPDFDPLPEEPAEPQASETAQEHATMPGPEEESDRTTTYWRYLTTGWRDRKRRGTD